MIARSQIRVKEYFRVTLKRHTTESICVNRKLAVRTEVWQLRQVWQRANRQAGKTLAGPAGNMRAGAGPVSLLLYVAADTGPGALSHFLSVAFRSISALDIVVSAS